MQVRPVKAPSFIMSLREVARFFRQLSATVESGQPGDTTMIIKQGVIARVLLRVDILTGMDTCSARSMINDECKKRHWDSLWARE